MNDVTHIYKYNFNKYKFIEDILYQYYWGNKK